MFGPEAENKVYVQSFCRSQEGHALWPKAYSKDLQPGCCGYVDGYGNFVKLVQLTDSAAIEKLSLDPLDGVEVVDDGGGTYWDTKISSQIVAAAINLDAKALPPGSPASASAGVQYTCNGSRGAILLTNGPVTSTWLEGVGTMKNWVNENIDTLVKGGDWASIKKRGVWAITRTYHAKECAKKVLSSKGQQASFHVGAGVPDLAHAKASAGWWKVDGSSSGWIVHRTPQKPRSEGTDKREQPREDNEDQRQDEDPSNGIVLFVQGIWWKPGALFSRKMKAESDKEKQDFLDFDPDLPLGAFVRNRDVAEGSEEDAFLQFLPGVVGSGEADEGLERYDDSFMMFEDVW